ncbi:hypothetical protein Tco_0754894 [Tanacetum coccineum]
MWVHLKNEADDSEEEDVQEVQSMGRDKVKKKTSSSSFPLESLVAPPIVHLLGDDAARQEAIIAVSKLFNKEYHAKQALKKQYAECKDIPPERRVVIEIFLHDESMKDLDVEHKLWRAMQKIQNNISHKIRWIHKENK